MEDELHHADDSQSTLNNIMKDELVHHGMAKKFYESKFPDSKLQKAFKREKMKNKLRLFYYKNAKFLNKEKVFWLTTDFMKFKGIRRIDGLMFRYIYPLNKKAKKMLKNSSMEWTKNYPKEKDLEWRDVTDRKNKKTISGIPLKKFYGHLLKRQ